LSKSLLLGLGDWFNGVVIYKSSYNSSNDKLGLIILGVVILSAVSLFILI
jgi:hypothetical protein